jgi:DNA-directed RNA polymerase subunit RPC12/RpoP
MKMRVFECLNVICGTEYAVEIKALLKHSDLKCPTCGYKGWIKSEVEIDSKE